MNDIQKWQDRVNLPDFLRKDQAAAAVSAMQAEIADLRAALSRQSVAPTAESAAPYEAAAKAIYALLEPNGQGGPDSHPWQHGGNSDMQCYARKLAHAAMTAYPEDAAPQSVAVGVDVKLFPWQELRADVLHGVDGLDNDQVNTVLGMIDYYAEQPVAAHAGDAGAVAWVVFAEYEGKMVAQYPATLDRATADAHARTYGQTKVEVRALYDHPAPADCRKYCQLEADEAARPAPAAQAAPSDWKERAAKIIADFEALKPPDILLKHTKMTGVMANFLREIAATPSPAVLDGQSLNRQQIDEIAVAVMQPKHREFFMRQVDSKIAKGGTQ